VKSGWILDGADIGWITNWVREIIFICQRIDELTVGNSASYMYEMTQTQFMKFSFGGTFCHSR
jgi:hypothetical protein